MTKKLFNKVLIIGVGLIGSSIARALKDYGLTGTKMDKGSSKHFGMMENWMGYKQVGMKIEQKILMF